ncbi:MAG: TonB-dependent receptor [Treponema sp.]|jgi:vitamin B12 transporter|nr:TonB-dependent receptor [Treponema sp.]
MLNFFRTSNFLPALSLLILFLIFPHAVQGQDSALDDEPLFIEDEGITVTGTTQTSQQMAIIEKDEIERSNAADLAVLLQEKLAINITRYGTYGNQAGISLRGLDSKRIAFLIDGVPVNSSIDGRFDIEQIDLNSIERIEVIYGGSDTKYNVSGAMGGVINIITVKKQKPGLRFVASVSNTSALPGEYRDRSDEKQGPHWEDLLDTQNFALSVVYGGNDFSIAANGSANRAENHFTFTDSYNRIRRKDNNEVWDAGGGASLVWNVSDLTKLIASANFYYGDKNIPSSGFSSIVGKQQDIFSRNNVMLDMPRIFRDDLATEASLGWHFSRKDFTSLVGTPSDAFSRHDQQAVTAINRWNWYSGDLLVVRSGFDYRFIYLDSTDVGSRNRHDGGIYVTAEYRPLAQFMIIPSVKAVFASGESSTIAAVPKLGLLWNVADSLAIKNNYFRSFKLPDFEELYWSGGGGFGNPGLRPEDGWGGDIGAEWRITKQAKLESVFFAHWLKDSIHWYPGTNGVWRPENVGEAMFFGLDNKLNVEIPVKWGPVKKITPALSYQYLLSYLLSFGYDFSSNKRIPYSPEHTLGASVEVSWGGGSASISAHYESARYDDRANLTELKPHFLLNAAVNQKIGNNFAVFATLRNILNESYESFYRYPMPGITLSLGMKFNIGVNNE